MQATVKLSGDRDVIEAFRDLRQYLPKNPIRGAVRKAAKQLEAAILDRAPQLTGKLKRNISVRVRITKKTARARVIINTKGKAENERNAFYWRFLEEGFRTRRGDFRRYPFVQSVFDAQSASAAQHVVDQVDRAIARAERRANKFR